MYARISYTGWTLVNRRAYKVRSHTASTYAKLKHNKYEPQPPKRIHREKPFGLCIKNFK